MLCEAQIIKQFPTHPVIYNATLSLNKEKEDMNVNKDDGKDTPPPRKDSFFKDMDAVTVG